MRKHAILFILSLGLAVRLYHVAFPIAGFAAWRQADTGAIARNFFHHGFHLLSPQIDWGGNTEGYVETEFPVYAYVISLCYSVFSPSDAWGRILSIAFAIATIWALYLLARKIHGERVALWAALIYAIIPLNIFYARAVMPESMMLMSSVLGIFFFTEWLDKRTRWACALAALFVSLAILLKITCLYLGLPLAFLLWQKDGPKGFARPNVWLFGLLILIPAVLWYYHAHQIYLSTGLSFGIWDYGSGKWGNFKPLLTLKFYNDIFFKSIAERHLTYAGFVPFLVGLFLPRKHPRERLFDWWLVAVAVYFGIVAVGNQIHEYYQLPFAVPAAVYIGRTFDRYLNSRSMRSESARVRSLFWVTALCLACIPVLSFLRVQSFMSGEHQDSPLFKLAGAVQERTRPDELIVTVDDGDPVLLYRCDRRGWHASSADIPDSFLERVKALGAKFVVGTKEYFDEPAKQEKLGRLMHRYPVEIDTPEYFILSLASP